MLDKSKNYLVLNYSSSPVCFNTRYESILIPGGTKDAPASLPLSVDEIVQANTGTPLFKCGLLFFEPEYAEELYDACRIKNWKDILTDEQIENILLHPTIEGLEKIINIETEIYFERCYGIYIGLLNANYPITANVSKVMRARRSEFRRNKTKSEIQLVAKDVASPITQEEYEATKSEINELKAAMEAMMKQNAELMKALSEKKTEAKKEETAAKPRKTTKTKEV